MSHSKSVKTTVVLSSGLKIHEVINDHFTGLQPWKKVMIAYGQMDTNLCRLSTLIRQKVTKSIQPVLSAFRSRLSDSLFSLTCIESNRFSKNVIDVISFHGNTK